MSKTPTTAHVYVFEAETGLVKIGYTTDAVQRVKKIQTYSGFKIRRQVVSPRCCNYREIEKALHQQFAKQRRQGEWFAIAFQVAVAALNQQQLETNPNAASTQLVAFQFENKEVRTFLDEKGNPWFVANDVCEILNIRNPRDAISRLDDDEKMTVVITDGLIKQGFSSNAPGTSLNLVNEYGLYALIFSSRKAEARRFKRWVTHEVLPTIRKTGKYEVNLPSPTPMPRPEYQDFDAFVTDCFISDSAGLVSAGNIYLAYKEWCQRCQRPVYTHKLLGQYLKERGYVPAKRTHGKFYWLGIRLRLQAEVNAPESIALSASKFTELQNYLEALCQILEADKQYHRLLVLLKTAASKAEELTKSEDK